MTWRSASRSRHCTWMSHYPNAELTVLPNAGHYPMFETPVALVTTIEQHLRQE